MAPKRQRQLTGMRGVYLVAAELSRLGFIASPTSRSAVGADILVTDQKCLRAHSVQVKTKSNPVNFWLVEKNTPVSDTHFYVLVNIGKSLEYFIIPSAEIEKKKVYSKHPNSEFWSVYRKDILSYKDNWSLFGTPA